MRWTCRTCGEEHEGLPLDWAYDAPAQWDGGRTDEDWLTEDLCVWTDDGGDPAYFVRGVLYIPIIETDETLRYGVWSSLSRKSFGRVIDMWNDLSRVKEPPYFGWLANGIADYPDTLNLPVDVVTDDPELRPTIVPHDGDHPLIRDHREGVPLERVRELAERRLHVA
jgi:hypothetical protein